MTLPKIKTIEISVDRLITASPAELFNVWLDSKSPGSPWFGVAKAIVYPTVGGLFYHSVQYEGRDWAHYGRFIVLDPPLKIQHTWVSEATGGLETIVTLTFAAQNNQTLVTLVQTNVPDDEMGRRHREGWGFVLDALANRFDQRPGK